LRAEASVELLFCRTAELIRDADIAILPGSKQTVDDLEWLRRNGLDRAVVAHATRGLVIGICGGMQMLGQTITDPEGVERMGRATGLALLPIHTLMRVEKVTRAASGMLYANSLFGQAIASGEVAGYEIHVGETNYEEHAQPFATLTTTDDNNPRWDGCVSSDGRVIGTYLHGVFDEDAFRHALLRAARTSAGLCNEVVLTRWKAKREDSLNRLAAEVSRAVDLHTIFDWVGQKYRSDSLTVGEGTHT